MLTPDTLLLLATNFQNVSVIARPNKLYVFTRKSYSYKADLGTGFSVEEIYNELNSITDKLLKINNQTKPQFVAETTAQATSIQQPANEDKQNTVVIG